MKELVIQKLRDGSSHGLVDVQSEHDLFNLSDIQESNSSVLSSVTENSNDEKKSNCSDQTAAKITELVAGLGTEENDVAAQLVEELAVGHNSDHDEPGHFSSIDAIRLVTFGAPGIAEIDARKISILSHLITPLLYAVFVIHKQDVIPGFGESELFSGTIPARVDNPVTVLVDGTFPEEDKNKKWLPFPFCSETSMKAHCQRLAECTTIDVVAGVVAAKRFPILSMIAHHFSQPIQRVMHVIMTEKRLSQWGFFSIPDDNKKPEDAIGTSMKQILDAIGFALRYRASTRTPHIYETAVQCFTREFNKLRYHNQDKEALLLFAQQVKKFSHTSADVFVLFNLLCVVNGARELTERVKHWVDHIESQRQASSYAQLS